MLITSNCPYSCIHCYTARFKGEPSKEEVISWLDKVSKLSDYIGITGGEPLVRKDIFDILEFAREKFKWLALQTNLSLLTNEKARRLREIELDIVYTSLDGHNEELHEVIRGKGSWSLLMKKLEMLKDIPFSTVTTINSFNWNVVDRIAEKAEKLGASSASFIPIIPAGRASKYLMPTPKQMKKAISKLSKAADHLGIPIYIWCYPSAKAIDENGSLNVRPCPSRSLDIAPDGRILLCDTLDIQISHINKSIEDIVRDYEESEWVKLVDNRKPESCLDCPYFDFCRGGCYARSLLVKGDIRSSDPLCSYR